MTTRQITRARRGWAVVALGAALTLTAGGCGGEGPTPGKAGPSRSAGAVEKSRDDDAPHNEVRDTSRTIATIKGAKGIVLTLHSATRDSGGFVTVSGQAKNTGTETYRDTIKWRGTERELVSGGGSVAGATLVDQKGKKRYYVLRDTEGRCLCTTGLNKIEAGKTVPVFMQFPAPPESTTEVDFQLPTFPTATIELSS